MLCVPQKRTLWLSLIPDNAESYKNDGNYNFKLKKYRWAVDNYTEGIKCKSKDKTINAILYSNRAAAQFHLGEPVFLPDSVETCVFAKNNGSSVVNVRTCMCCRKFWFSPERRFHCQEIQTRSSQSFCERFVCTLAVMSDFVDWKTVHEKLSIILHFRCAMLHGIEAVR